MHGRNQRVSDVETSPGLRQIQKAPCEQARKREQHYRQHHLQRHETITQIPAADGK